MAQEVKVVWSPIALKQLDEIGEFIAKDAPQAAVDFVIRLLDATNPLPSFPFSGAICPEDPSCRQVVLDGYRIVYELKIETIDVLTIISPGQDAITVVASVKKP